MITRRKFLKKAVGVVTAVIVGPAVLSAIPEKVEAEQVTVSGLLGYEEIYTSDEGGYFVPSGISDELIKEIARASPIRRMG